MPQLMPLSWILSNLMLLVILLVMFSLYCSSYFGLSFLKNSGNSCSSSVILWW